MTQRFARSSLILVAVPACLALAAACSSDPAAPSGSSGAPGAGGSSASGSSSGGSATQPTAGAGLGGGAAGTPANTSGSSSGGMSGSGSGGTTSGGSSSAGAGGSAGSAGTGGSASGGSGGGKVPACVTLDVEDGVDRGNTNYIECDFEAQGIDFDVMAAYPANRNPGYDPSTTPASFTDFGTGFTGSIAHECHPYCWKGNLTIGLDVLAGNEASTKGEVLFAFPPTVAPIANAKGRDSLGWVYLDGPALPQGTKVTVQMVLKATGKAPVLGTGTHDLPKGQWVEFKYFPIQQGFADADLLNITHIGFRATVSPAPAADWHGVIYADHFQLRE